MALAGGVDAKTEPLTRITRKTVCLDERTGQRERHDRVTVRVTRDMCPRPIALLFYCETQRVEAFQHSCRSGGVEIVFYLTCHIRPRLLYDRSRLTKTKRIHTSGWRAWVPKIATLDYERLPQTLAGLHYLAFAVLMISRVADLIWRS